jgi:hypothetical protein
MIHRKKKIILGITAGIVTLVVLLGSVVWITNPDFIQKYIFNTQELNTTPENTQTRTPQERLEALRVESYNAAEVNDEAAIQRVEERIQEEVAVAEESQDDDYIVDAYITQATLLIETNRAQTALDTILPPLVERYENDQTYSDGIYAVMSWAYRVLGEADRAAEYLDQVSGESWE